MDGAATETFDVIEVRTADIDIVHDRVVVGDVGDVDGLVDDGEVLRAVDDEGAEAVATAKRMEGNEVVVAGADTVVGVRPGAKAHGGGPAGFGRKGGPADVLIRLPPRNPGGSPVGGGDPEPTRLNVHPTPVVVGGPAEGFIGDPGPACFSVRPVAIDIGAPSGVVDVEKGLPAVAVAFDVSPVTMRGEGLIKELDGDCGLLSFGGGR